MHFSFIINAPKVRLILNRLLFEACFNFDRYGIFFLICTSTCNFLFFFFDDAHCKSMSRHSVVCISQGRLNHNAIWITTFTNILMNSICIHLLIDFAVNLPWLLVKKCMARRHTGHSNQRWKFSKFEDIDIHRPSKKNIQISKRPNDQRFSEVLKNVFMV